ncbi:hypothetical protein PPACK8108_LOCUS10531 [Phakopsora pachyrhizi]|uniref:Uncharacterized protein n=1 Tax=Phakopsora pachyrhizi TaxID=170000 RepID=A0AAV0AZ27_PHAPC|nr:hypothetical protein PPACK8108_LOCUS10531 [Phakopsora pachyrhizi]
MIQDPASKSSRITHSRSSSSSSHRVPVPPLIPKTPKPILQGKDASYSAIYSSYSNNFKLSFSGGSNYNIDPNVVSNLPKDPPDELIKKTNNSKGVDVTDGNLINNENKKPIDDDYDRCVGSRKTGSLISTNSALEIGTPARPQKQEIINRLIEVKPNVPPPAPVFFPTSRASSTFGSSHQGINPHHYRLHSKSSTIHPFCHSGAKHYGRTKASPVYVCKPSPLRKRSFKEKAFSFVECLGGFIVYICISVSEFFSEASIRAQEKTRDFLKQDPSSLERTIPNTKRPTKIYRRIDAFRTAMHADILYLQDSPFATSNIPDFMGSFLQAGCRVIVPQIQIADKGSLFCLPNQATDIAKKTQLVTEVISNVINSDNKLYEKENSSPEFGSKLIRTRRHSPTVEAQVVQPSVPAHIETTSQEKIAVKVKEIQSEVESNEGNRPLFIIGLGHSSLIALSYPIENQPLLNLPSTSKPGSIFSIPSISVRAEPSNSFTGRLDSFYTSIQFGFSGLSRWAKDPIGDVKKRADQQISAEKKSEKAKPVTQLCGVIAIGPTLDPNYVNKATNFFQKIRKGIGPEAYLPSIKSAIQKLYLNANKIKVPVLIAHGTKEAYACISGINSLYESLPSPNCTLIFCPTIRHQGNLAHDAAQSGLGKKSLTWMKARIAQTMQKKYSKNFIENLRKETSNQQKGKNRTDQLSLTESLTKKSFDSVRDVSDDTRLEAYSRCSSSMSINFPMKFNGAEEEEPLEELKEENLEKSSGPSPNSFRPISPNAGKFSAGYHMISSRSSAISFSNSLRNVTDSPHTQLRPSIDSQKAANLKIFVPEIAKDLKEGTPSPISLYTSSGFSSPGPLTPSSATFSPQFSISAGAEELKFEDANSSKRGLPTAPQNINSSARHSIDSLCIEIPCSSLGINY